MSSPHQETVAKARTRVLEMLADPGMMGGDGIGVTEVDALIAAVQAESRVVLQRSYDAICVLPLDSADAVLQEFSERLHITETPRDHAERHCGDVRVLAGIGVIGECRQPRGHRGPHTHMVNRL